jgi:hypothetical protein
MSPITPSVPAPTPAAPNTMQYGVVCRVADVATIHDNKPFLGTAHLILAPCTRVFFLACGTDHTLNGKATWYCTTTAIWLKSERLTEDNRGHFATDEYFASIWGCGVGNVAAVAKKSKYFVYLFDGVAELADRVVPISVQGRAVFIRVASHEPADAIPIPVNTFQTYDMCWTFAQMVLPYCA